MKIGLAFLTGLFWVCNSHAQSQVDSAVSLIRFIQNDSVYSINSESASITLKKAPFSIRYFCKPYDSENTRFHAARVAVMEARDNAIQSRVQIIDFPCFSPGTGMAAGEKGYEAVYITNEAHHYLYYENEKDKRVKLVSTNGDLLELDWKISAFVDAGKKTPVKKLKPDSLYFIILIDRDLDGQIDAGELKKVKVLFIK